MYRRSEVEVEIVGGLGNQLFGYAAGLFLSQKNNSKLRLNLSMVGVGGMDHGRTLRGFAIPSDCFTEGNTSNFLKPRFILRVVNKIARHSKVFRILKDLILNEYTATQIGFEEDFWRLRHARKVRGYFQTYLYADSVVEELKHHLVLTMPSNWFLAQLESLTNLDPIALHIRRGDYLNLQDEFGILDISYYENALLAIPDAKEREIWIFTDSPQIVSIEVRGTTLENSTIIEPPIGVSANESLVLMSKVRTLVIGNSTFSWWAAYLNSEKSEIYAPLTWFKGREDPEKLIPPAWNLCESIWR